jgi:MFS family permease
MTSFEWGFYKARKNFVHIFSAELILRWFYQVGKTPLLPLFAAAIGAAEMMIGMIVAVSTFSGMLLKPIFGILSDRWGRRVWLGVSLFIFTFTPFLYQFISSDIELFWLRLFHGIATAILGPVSLAYVAELNNDTPATRLAIFGMARSLASLGAPLFAGVALTVFEFQTVFTFIGFGSLMAMGPIFLLRDQINHHEIRVNSVWFQIRKAFQYSFSNPAIWIAGFLELIVYLVVYALKAFLPLFILSLDSGTILQAGMFFTLQETLHMCFRPVGGRLADEKGYGPVIFYGMMILAVGLSMITFLSGNLIFIIAIFLGVSQAFIFPSSVALLASRTDIQHRGAAMGFYGALRNFGKVLGPVLAGFLLSKFDFASVFMGFSGFIFVTTILAVPAWRRIVEGLSD